MRHCCFSLNVMDPLRLLIVAAGLLLISHVTVGECCTQGFPTLSAINSLAASCSQSNRCLRDSGRGDSGSTYIMPNMRFTCDGTIVRWSAGDIHDPEPYIYMNLVYMTIELIRRGYRMPPPPGCPRALYELMIRCWHFDAMQRSVFSAIVKMLSHSDSQLLSWNSKDLSVHPHTSRLGAPKEVGDELYQDLQDYYLNRPNQT